jgi:hypothetical protein
MHQKPLHSKVPFFVSTWVLFMSVIFPAEIYQREAVPLEKQLIELGNSDRIRLKFGNYGIEVLESGLRIRVSKLYSIDGGVKTNRTFAVVSYPAIIEPEFSKEHDAIINGQSIGIVFRDNGWAIDKRHLYVGKVESSCGYLGVDSVFGNIGKTRPVIHLYSLFVRKDGSEFQYASIAEVHHPEYLDLDDLSLIYGHELDSSRARDKDINDFLDIVKSKMQDAGRLA